MRRSRSGLLLALLTAGCTVGLDLGAHDGPTTCGAGSVCDGGEGGPPGDGGGDAPDGPTSDGDFGPSGILPSGPWVAAARGIEGGDLRSLAHDASDPSVIFAASWGAGIFRSPDAAKTWLPASAGLGDRLCISHVAAHPARAGVVFALAAGCERRGEPFRPLTYSVVRTTDSGASWSPVATSIAAGVLDENSAVAASASAPDTVYVKTRASVWRSTDGGVTATMRSRLDGQPGPEDRVVVDPKNKDVLYIIHGGALSKSVDGGATFTGLVPPVPPSGLDVTQIVLSPTDPQVLHASRLYTDSFATSRDGGATWTPRPAPGAYGGQMVPCATDPKRLYLATASGLYATTDEWTSVAPLAAPAPLGLSRTRSALGLQAASVDPHACDRIAFAGELVWSSSDGGQSIVEASQGITNRDVDALEIASSDPSVLYAGSLARLFRTADEGRHWSHVTATGLGDREDITAITIDGATADTLYVASFDSATVPATPRKGHLYRSVDGGRTLTALDLTGAMPVIDGGTPRIDRLALHGAGSAAPLFVFATGRIAVSRDAGVSFASVATTVAAAAGRWRTVSRDPSNGKAFTAVWVESPDVTPTRSHVLRTTDDGATFTEVAAGLAVSGGDLFNGLYGVVHDRKRAGLQYACGEDGVYRSTDAGTTWTRSVTGVPTKDGLSCRRIFVTAGDGHVVFLDQVGGTASFYASTDAGVTWQAGRGITPSGDLGEAVRDLVPHPSAPKTLYVGLRGSVGVARTTTLGL